MPKVTVRTERLFTVESLTEPELKIIRNGLDRYIRVYRNTASMAGSTQIARELRALFEEMLSPKRPILGALPAIEEELEEEDPEDEEDD